MAAAAPAVAQVPPSALPTCEELQAGAPPTEPGQPAPHRELARIAPGVVGGSEALRPLIGPYFDALVADPTQAGTAADFFVQSGAGRSLGQAMQAAQIQLMDDPLTSHPYYWAAFAIVGDATKPLTTQ